MLHFQCIKNLFLEVGLEIDPTLIQTKDLFRAYGWKNAFILLEYISRKYFWEAVERENVEVNREEDNPPVAPLMQNMSSGC